MAETLASSCVAEADRETVSDLLWYHRIVKEIGKDSRLGVIICQVFLPKGRAAFPTVEC